MLDALTILLSYSIITFVGVIVITLLWFQNRKRYAGIGYWVANFFLQLVALLLIGLRGTLPDLVSVVLGNALVIFGLMLLYQGVEHFVEKPKGQIHNYVVLAVFVLIHAYFTFVQPSIQARNINVAFAFLTFFFQSAWLIFHRLSREASIVMREVGTVAVLYCLVSLARISMNLVIDPGNDFFEVNFFEALSFLIYQALLVAGTFSLVLVVNRRLVMNLENDIEERLQTQEALRESEKLYHQMFHDHSAMMLLIDPETGNIIEANPAAADFYGYPVEDFQKMNIQQINVLDPSENAKRCKEIKNKEQTYFIFQHRLASGKIREVEVSSMPIKIRERALLYSIIHDVTERKQIDDAVRYRNELLAALQQVMLNLVNRHDLDDILNALLVEISKLLNAPDISVDLLENEDTLITYAVTPDQPLQVRDSVRRGEGGWLSWQAIETGQPISLDDYSSREKRRSLFEGYPIHAILIVPIKHQDQVIGAINILRNEPNRPFNDTDVYVAEQLARMVALVLDNANIYAQLQAELKDRKKAEQALRESEHSLMRAQSVSRTGHYVWDLEANTLTWSLEIYHILGLHPDSYTPTTENFIEFVHPDNVSALSRENMQRLIRFNSHELEFRIIDQISKQEKYIYLWGETTFDSNGDPAQVLGILQDISDRKYNEEAAIMLSAFEERQRLARDLHDSVSQSLHSLVLFAETVSYNFEQGQLDNLEHLISRMGVSARQAYKEMRLMLYELQAPWEKKHLSLQEALQARLRAVESRSQVETELIVEGFPQWPQEWEGNLFWIATEALNNALKHSRAEQVSIHLRNDGGLIVLEVIDNGIGFDSASAYLGGMGLDNMAVRAAQIGGVLAVVSAPGEGTCIRLEARKEVS